MDLPVSGIEFVTIWTADLELSRAFYVERLGFKILSEQAGAFFQIAVGGVPICVDLNASRKPSASNQIGIRVTDLEATVATLTAAGIDVQRGQRTDATEHWVSIKDPDGHELIFIEHN